MTMQPTENKGAPVDVLAVLRSHRDTCGIQGCAWCVELDQVIAAVDELIEADKEYDAAKAECDESASYDSDGVSVPKAIYQRMKAAESRRSAALARVGGAS